MRFICSHDEHERCHRLLTVLDFVHTLYAGLDVFLAVDALEDHKAPWRSIGRASLRMSTRPSSTSRGAPWETNHTTTSGMLSSITSRTLKRPKIRSADEQSAGQYQQHDATIGVTRISNRCGSAYGSDWTQNHPERTASRATPTSTPTSTQEGTRMRADWITPAEATQVLAVDLAEVERLAAEGLIERDPGSPPRFRRDDVMSLASVFRPDQKPIRLHRRLAM